MNTPVWTPERDALLLEIYPTYTSNAEVMRRLNELSGIQFTDISYIKKRAHILKIRRPSIRIWTEERDALVCALYPTDTASIEILRLLNQMPGAPVKSVKQITARASDRLHLQRFSDRVWTDARNDLVRAKYPDAINCVGLLAELNKLPGAPVSSTSAVANHASRALGLRRTHSNIWTRERDDLLEALYPTGMPLEELYHRLNALPGRPVPTKSSITARANQIIRVRRPASPLTRKPPAHPQKQRAPRVFVNQEPVAATLDEVRLWAKTYGVRFRDWEDMRVVNSAREDRFLPVFKREFGRKVA